MIKRKGDIIIQGPTSADSPMMPRATINAAEMDEMVVLKERGAVLVKHAQISSNRGGSWDG
jgi:hypothetical protein